MAEEILNIEELTGRSEEQVLFNDPLSVTFAGQEYRFRKASMGKSRRWREKVIAFQGEVLNSSKTATKDEVNAMATLQFMTVEALDRMAELVIDYCGTDSGITKEVIEEGTEDELLDAWKKVCQVGFPLAVMTAGITTFHQALSNRS